MATSTLVQFIAAGEGADTSNRRQVETFIAGGTIVAGDVVALDTTQTGADKVLYVIQAANVATGNPLAKTARIFKSLNPIYSSNRITLIASITAGIRRFRDSNSLSN